MTTPPSYREQDACANCKRVVYRYGFLHCGLSEARALAELNAYEAGKLPIVEPNAICAAHERREAGRG